MDVPSGVTAHPQCIKDDNVCILACKDDSECGTNRGMKCNNGICAFPVNYTVEFEFKYTGNWPAPPAYCECKGVVNAAPRTPTWASLCSDSCGNTYKGVTIVNPTKEGENWEVANVSIVNTSFCGDGHGSMALGQNLTTICHASSYGVAREINAAVFLNVPQASVRIT